MHIIKDDHFKEQLEAFRLQFTCESCAYFRERDGACAMLYPTQAHRTRNYEATPDGGRVYFCKTFEAAD